MEEVATIELDIRQAVPRFPPPSLAHLLLHHCVARQECSELGDVSDVRLPRWGDEGAGCAYVDFEFGDDAVRAKKALDNRK